MNPYAIPTADLARLAPELTLCVAGTLVLLLEAFAPRLRPAFTWLALVGTGLAAWFVAQPLTAAGGSFQGLIESTPLTSGLAHIVLLVTALALAGCDAYLRRERILAGEYHALLLWAATGLLLLVRGVELLTIFLALELLSVCLYALAGFHRRVAVGGEAAIKYFLMGAFVSAFVLYGIALVYGETGTTDLAALAHAIAEGRETSPGLLTLGLLLIVAGFAFKMSLVPFHAWSPDVYQGAPSPFVAFLSVAPKAGAALVLVRLVDVASRGALGGRWLELMALLAVVSMVVGNLLALVQRDIKRMLAYSGIAHMGYLLIPLAALDPAESWRAVLVYLVAYALMNAGAFVIVGLLYARADAQHAISDLAGWGYRFPLLGGALAVCMLSLAGIPPTVGFLGKYLVFVHAIGHHQTWLALVGVAASLVGVFYYLRVIYVLYMRPEVKAPEGLRLDFGGRLAAVVAAGATLILGVWPDRLFAWAAAIVQRLG